jgi:hypothetical protein
MKAEREASKTRRYEADERGRGGIDIYRGNRLGRSF